MTIRIPDDLARELKGIAAAQKRSVEELAVERLRSLFDRPTSPAAVLRTIRELPHPSRPALDDLDAAIAAARQWMHTRWRVETMGFMTIRIPDDLVRELEGIAVAEQKSVEELAVERLRSLFHRPTSPADVLRTIRELPHPSRPALDDLDVAIAAARLPVRDRGAFDR